MSSAFTDKSRCPGEASLVHALGTSKRHWDAILERLDLEGDAMLREWKFYRGYGWQLKVTHRKRAVLYLVPQHGRFLAAMALSDAAVFALRSSGLPAGVIEDVENARVYPEGRPARIEVTDARQADVVTRLLAIKRTVTRNRGTAPSAGRR